MLIRWFSWCLISYPSDMPQGPDGFLFDVPNHVNYNAKMKTKLVQIGNSKGVRIPKALIERAGINGNVDMEVLGNSIILRSKKPLAGWEDAFKLAVTKHGRPKVDREFLDAPLLNDSDLPPW